MVSGNPKSALYYKFFNQLRAVGGRLNGIGLLETGFEIGT
jgi:hypothetical protein